MSYPTRSEVPCGICSSGVWRVLWDRGELSVRAVDHSPECPVTAEQMLRGILEELACPEDGLDRRALEGEGGVGQPEPGGLFGRLP